MNVINAGFGIITARQWFSQNVHHTVIEVWVPRKLEMFRCFCWRQCRCWSLIMEAIIIFVQFCDLIYREWQFLIIGACLSILAFWELAAARHFEVWAEKLGFNCYQRRWPCLGGGPEVSQRNHLRFSNTCARRRRRATVKHNSGFKQGGGFFGTWDFSFKQGSLEGKIILTELEIFEIGLKCIQINTKQVE